MVIKHLKTDEEWHDYFVWFPGTFKLGDFYTSNRDKHKYFIWLETIERRKVYFTTTSGYVYEYRLKGQGDG